MNSKLRKTAAVLSFIIGATPIFAHPDDQLYHSGARWRFWSERVH